MASLSIAARLLGLTDCSPVIMVASLVSTFCLWSSNLFPAVFNCLLQSFQFFVPISLLRGIRFRGILLPRPRVQTETSALEIAFGAFMIAIQDQQTVTKKQATARLKPLVVG